MKLFGKAGSWYRRMVCAYKYYMGQGEFFVGEIEGLITVGGSGAMIIVVIQKYTDYLLPWWVAILIVVFLKILKVFIGRLDRKYFKMGQAMTEFTKRKEIDVWEAEKMKILKNIEKAVSPETASEEHKTYI